MSLKSNWQKSAKPTELVENPKPFFESINAGRFSRGPAEPFPAGIRRERSADKSKKGPREKRPGRPSGAENPSRSRPNPALTPLVHSPRKGFWITVRGECSSFIFFSFSRSLSRCLIINLTPPFVDRIRANPRSKGCEMDF